MIKYHLRMEENGEVLWGDLYDNHQQAYDSMENSFKSEKKKGYTIAKIDKNSAIIQSYSRKVKWAIIEVDC